MSDRTMMAGILAVMALGHLVGIFSSSLNEFFRGMNVAAFFFILGIIFSYINREKNRN